MDVQTMLAIKHNVFVLLLIRPHRNASREYHIAVRFVIQLYILIHLIGVMLIFDTLKRWQTHPIKQFADWQLGIIDSITG
jgi:hypothetical protein